MAQSTTATHAPVPKKRSRRILDRLLRYIRHSFLFDARVDHTPSSHLTGVLLLGALVIAPFLLSFDRPHHEGSAQLEVLHISLPEMCLSHKLFGVDCPGCGLTRAFVALAHGEWSLAFGFHRLGAVLYGYLLILIAFHCYGFVLRKRPLPMLLIRCHHIVGITIIALLLVNWALPLIT